MPALPGITTEGDTLEEAIALHIEGMLADGEAISTETQHPQTIVVKLQHRQTQALVGGVAT